ncbi:ribonuclease toxin immunity protein CdiI [Actinobacillus equuli subsp. equuli]|uniref:ribonuclease toxin immunity protein CdiI n=1 Tax=Actinobacillus equuli TaxID=718 RepID=UPI00244238C3|nr:ribonuclease toxin immunity protein CdiI [Actinobacillus equuli]WGE54253.1 ribonuclease toxin immunity protein CdiI [Actinobacillus equuli subsp. equuli]
MYTQNNILLAYHPKGKDSKRPLSFFWEQIERDEPASSIGTYMNLVYRNGIFLNAVYDILVDKYAGGTEGADCWYDDSDDGIVYFEIGGMNDPYYQIQVSEQVCFEYFKKACKRFLELHPEQEYADFLNPILDNWKPNKSK